MIAVSFLGQRRSVFVVCGSTHSHAQIMFLHTNVDVCVYCVVCVCVWRRPGQSRRVCFCAPTVVCLLMFLLNLLRLGCFPSSCSSWVYINETHFKSNLELLFHIESLPYSQDINVLYYLLLSASKALHIDVLYLFFFRQVRVISRPKNIL